MIASAIHNRRTAGGLRLLDPSRDLLQVADLIEESFAGEIGPDGLAAVRDLRMMAYCGPLVWLMERASSEFRDAFTGFVWVEDGRVVGNVTLSRSKPLSARWYISNVAVKPAYRRRGIGRRLVEAALELAEARQGEWAVLYVRRDNAPALRIYRALGFEELFALCELSHEELTDDRPPAAPAGYQVRAWRPADWQHEYDLALAATSPLERWMRGPEALEFRRPITQRLGDWLNDFVAGGRTWRICLLRGEAFAGTLTVRSRDWGRDNRLAFRVHPQHRGEAERLLVRYGLHLLGDWSSQPVFAEHPAEHAEGIAALQEAGFREKRTLVTMRRPL